MLTERFDRLLVARHGETAYNRRGLTTGSRDPGLTRAGTEQARRLAAFLPRFAVTAICTSRARRCIETAAPVAAAVRLPLVVVPGLEERGWGELEGKPHALRLAAAAEPPPSVEPVETFRARILAALATVPGPRPVLLTHSGVFRILRESLGIVIAGTAAPAGETSPSLPNGGLAVLTPNEGRWVLEEVCVPPESPAV